MCRDNNRNRSQLRASMRAQTNSRSSNLSSRLPPFFWNFLSTRHLVEIYGLNPERLHEIKSSRKIPMILPRAVWYFLEILIKMVKSERKFVWLCLKSCRYTLDFNQNCKIRKKIQSIDFFWFCENYILTGLERILERFWKMIK